MNENINNFIDDGTDETEGMGAVLWIIASLVVLTLAICSIIILNNRKNTYFRIKPEICI